MTNLEGVEMSFIKYQHIERLGTDEVQGIEFGSCYVFPKIDGANASVWIQDGKIRVASRNRELEGSFQGFKEYIESHKGINNLLENSPHLRLYGEWLVPHSLKTYKDGAWRKFYIFDVAVDKEVTTRLAEDRVIYLTYDFYKLLLDEYEVEYIPAIVVLENGSYDQFISLLEKNNFLIKDGCGIGEGIVIKNYNFVNRFGRMTWAKVVTSEFKEKHIKEMGPSAMKGKSLVEESIAEKYVTQALIEKIHTRIVQQHNGWSSRFIPQLLGTVLHELIIEEAWHFVKEYKMPTVNFRTLNSFVIKKIKELKPELF